MSVNNIFKNHCMLIGKHIFFFFLSFFATRNFRSVVLKVGGTTPFGVILRGKGAKRPKGEMGEKQHKGGKNVQPLINL